MGAVRLQVRHLRKVYPGTVALDDVTLGFEGGQVHALLGKNGAGKSTLVKIIAGAVEPTAGEIVLDGSRVAIRSPRDALERGIATVHQELSIVPELSVAENILLGRWPRKRAGPWRGLDWAAVEELAGRTLREMRVTLDPRQKAGRLGVAGQQIMEIARAMSFRPSVLLLDEPTSALAHHEVDALFALVRRLVEFGVAVVYITHRLQELRGIADRVSVLRDGSLAGSFPVAEATPRTIVEMMFGEAVSRPRTQSPPPGPPLLEVRGLSMKDRLDDVSFTLRRGEVLGIAGMLGSGRTELLMAVFGALPFDCGEVVVEGRSVRQPTPARMKRAGVALTPENRKAQGLVLSLSTRDNICLAALRRISRAGFVWKRLQRRLARRRIDELAIKVADVDRPVSVLSGGNQQKVIVANWLNTGPRVILLDEPTRGIDVQARQQIFSLVRKLAGRGMGVVFVSSELEELLEVCDRILIMLRGRICGEVASQGLALERLFAMCMGEQG